ncbi:MAG: flagellar basal body L-ring protein FlgH [Alphaproteobacteria bacterium]|nr:flagellar basal body L-ring protein FlgH [Alphaproteobacteria bacterium]
MKHIALILMASVSLSACAIGEKLSEVGAPPAQSSIENPTLAKGYQPITMPMPTPEPHTKLANSLWSGDKRGFFKDQRASTVGDILTVTINMDDEAKFENDTTRSRTSGTTAGAPTLMGMEVNPAQGRLAKVLPEAFSLGNLFETDSNTTHNGSGEIERKEKIELKLAATITQVLPNGNMVIKGRQEIRVNYENRVLDLSGVIRPQDIAIDNSVPYDKIAEARISYGGKGQIMDVQQPPYGQQVLEILSPF